ncbi:unnamed protein product [Nyctereutes procyonoides]|uniref:(raccoon dog) hypothetical protein n=1 Tax=Nyctereutes procyonoides TaxID=34880 RepID=A0A811YTY9_NYCPR|nr:unnamed protein product [Nyctereutes procyonoides]
MSSNKCFKCGPSSYWAPECSTGGGGRGHGMRNFQFVSLSLLDTCYHCGKSGYLPRIKEQCCYHCGKLGHLSHDCDHADKQKCGETGHIAINCSRTNEVNCYHCGEPGHLVKECTIEAIS